LVHLADSKKYNRNYEMKNQAINFLKRNQSNKQCFLLFKDSNLGLVRGEARGLEEADGENRWNILEGGSPPESRRNRGLRRWIELRGLTRLENLGLKKIGALSIVSTRHYQLFIYIFYQNKQIF
jgi:hypothetical protein